MSPLNKHSTIRFIGRILYDAFRALTVRDPPFPELVSDYEEYHSRSLMSPLAMMRYRLVSSLIDEHSEVLDVGCGDGTFMLFLSRNKKCYVEGIEVSRRAAIKAIKKGFKVYIRDIEQDGIDVKKKFDYIVFMEVIEHLKFPQKVLLEAVNIAKKGVIVTIPNSGYILWRLQMLRGLFPRQSFTHLHFWSIKDFEIFAYQIGLKVTKIVTEIDFIESKHMRKLLNFFRNSLAYQSVFFINSSEEIK